MTILQRITTEYIEAEDRVRFSGAGASGETVSLWITQRLLARLLKVILNWTAEGEDGQQALKNAFAQQAARADLKLQLSVPAQPSAVLVNTIDISHTADALTLVFRGERGVAGQLTLQRPDVRQWLNILHDTWCRAEWPQDLWPDWMARSQAGPAATTQVTLH
jgi:hypothetical protein